MWYLGYTSKDGAKILVPLLVKKDHLLKNLAEVEAKALFLEKRTEDLDAKDPKFIWREVFELEIE